MLAYGIYLSTYLFNEKTTLKHFNGVMLIIRIKSLQIFELAVMDIIVCTYNKITDIINKNNILFFTNDYLDIRKIISNRMIILVELRIYRSVRLTTTHRYVEGLKTVEKI